MLLVLLMIMITMIVCWFIPQLPTCTALNSHLYIFNLISAKCSISKARLVDVHASLIRMLLLFLFGFYYFICWFNHWYRSAKQTFQKRKIFQKKKPQREREKKQPQQFWHTVKVYNVLIRISIATDKIKVIEIARISCMYTIIYVSNDC